MSSVVKGDETGSQIDLGRENWFSSESIRMLEEACDNPKVGPAKTLSLLLHFGMGLPLALIAKLTGTTKNVVAKQIITGTRRLRKIHAASTACGQRSLF